MVEKDIETYFVRQASIIGALVWKLTSPSTSGVPDRLFIKDGKVIFVELKRPKGNLRKLQEYRRKQLTRQGLRVECLNDKTDIDQFIESMKGEANEIHTAQVSTVC